MNVKLAAQLLSTTTALALNNFGEKVVSFEELVRNNKVNFTSRQFDMLNSMVLYDQKFSRNAFESNESQNNVLKDMADTMTTLKAYDV